MFPPTKRVEGGATVVPIPRFCAYDTRDRVPVFIVVALIDWAVTALLVKTFPRMLEMYGVPVDDGVFTFNVATLVTFRTVTLAPVA